MTDRELLQTLFDFLRSRTFITADEASARDMVTRYQNPPLTLYRRAAMQMTMNEYQQLGALLEQLKVHLEGEPERA